MHEQIGGDGLHRETIIIHCAHKPVSDKENNDALTNYNLTANLLKLPHKKFVFISSIDIYRKDAPNGKNKLDCEALVREYGKDQLTLRLPLIMGRYQRPNCLSKIKEGDSKITLSGDSEIYYIYDDEVLELLKAYLKENVSGTHDVLPRPPIKLKEYAKNLNKKVEFGDYLYQISINGKN